MEFQRMERPKQKAVPPARSVIIQVIFSAATGLVLIVVGLLRVPNWETVSLANLILPLVGLVLVGLAALTGRNLPAAMRLDSNGTITPGTIMDKWTKTDADDERECYVAYEYGPGNAAYQKVSWKRYRQIRIGDEVEVRFLSDEPGLSRLEGE